MRMSSPAPPSPSESCEGLVTFQARLYDRNVCEDCWDDDYEEIEINAFTDTVEQVKMAIAAQLGIEAEEFVFDPTYVDPDYESKRNVLFAKLYFPGDYESDLKKGRYKVDPLDIDLYANRDYKGKTGMLKWILSQEKDLYCGHSYPEGNQLAKRLAKHIAAFKAQHNIPLESWDGLVTLRVCLPERSVCEDCAEYDYEEITINAPADTVEKVKYDIATRLGIEADEFVFDPKYDDADNEYKPGVVFAEIYFPSDYESDLKEGHGIGPFDIDLYANKGYKGETGMLKWILSQKQEYYCGEFGLERTQLSGRLAKHIAAFKAQDSISSTSSAPVTLVSEERVTPPGQASLLTRLKGM